MNGIQLVLITGVILVAIYFLVRQHNSMLDFFLLLSMVTAALIFIFFLGITNYMAHKLGVGRGADLVFYLSIIIFWFVIIKLYIRIRKLEKTVTDVLRKDALDEADKKTTR